MKITTKISWAWDGEILEHEFFEYAGPVALGCGAPAGQQQLATEQANYYQTLTQNAQSEFSQSSNLAADFLKEFNPILQAGPNQLGWNTQEAADVNSNIVTTEGQATRNAQQAAGTQVNGLGNGNEYTPQGASTAIKNSINVAGAQATAQSQQNAQLADYQQGFQNFETAASALSGTPNLYATSTGAAGAANTGGSAADTTYNNIATEEMSPLSLVSSALGAAGTALAKP